MSAGAGPRRASGHRHDLSRWQHNHVFDSGNRRAEARTRWVLALTLATMAAEITAGWWTGSMALLADGWHMGTHALALGVSVLAYAFARRLAGDRRYSFGTWKIEVLGGYSSALVLAIVAAGIGFESAQRLWQGHSIEAAIALQVAVIGLVVNVLSAWLLHGAKGGDHAHGHGMDMATVMIMMIMITKTLGESTAAATVGIRVTPATTTTTTTMVMPRTTRFARRLRHTRAIVSRLGATSTCRQPISMC